MHPHSHDSVCVYMCLLIKLLWRAIQHVPWKQGLPWKECFLVDGRRNEDLIPSFSLVLEKDINLCSYWHQQSYSWKTSAWTNRPDTFAAENFWHQGWGDVCSPAFPGHLSSYLLLTPPSSAASPAQAHLWHVLRNTAGATTSHRRGDLQSCSSSLAQFSCIKCQNLLLPDLCSTTKHFLL